MTFNKKIVNSMNKFLKVIAQGYKFVYCDSARILLVSLDGLRTTKVMKRIILVSKITKLIILLGLVIHTAVFTFFAIVNSNTLLLNKSFSEDHLNLFAINDKWSFYAKQLDLEGINSFWLLGTVDFIAQFLISFFLYKLFALYEKGEIFSSKNCQYLQLIGITFFGYGLCMVFLPWFISTTINLLFSEYRLDASLYFGSTELTQLVLGTVILAMSWIMDEACHLKNEQDLVV